MLSKLLKTHELVLPNQKPETGLSQLGHPSAIDQSAFDQILASTLGTRAASKSGISLRRQHGDSAISLLGSVRQLGEKVTSKNLGLAARSISDSLFAKRAPRQALQLTDDVKPMDSQIVGNQKTSVNVRSDADPLKGFFQGAGVTLGKQPLLKNPVPRSVKGAINSVVNNAHVQPANEKKANSTSAAVSASHEESSQPSKSTARKFAVARDTNQDALRTSVANPGSLKLDGFLFEQDSQPTSLRVGFRRQPEPASSKQVNPQSKDPSFDKSGGSASIRDPQVQQIDPSTGNEMVRTQTSKINVDTLGQISIKPQLVDAHVRLEMSVQSEAAREWLQNRLKTLGFDLSKMKISVRENAAKEHPESAKGAALPKLAPSQALDRIQEIYQAARRTAVRALDSAQNEWSQVNPQRVATPAKLIKLNSGDEIPNKSAQPSILPDQNQAPRASSDRVIMVPEGMTNKSGSRVKAAGRNAEKSDSNSVPRAPASKQNSGVQALKQESLNLKSGETELDGLVKSVSDSGSSSRGDSNSTTFSGPSLASANTDVNIINGKLMGGQMVERSQLPEMMQKIIDLANSQSSLTSHKLEVQMKVEKLGDLLVDAVKQQDKIHLQISVESNEVRRLIEAQIRPLVEQMVKEGIEIGKLEVSLKHSKDQGQDQDLARHNTNNFSDRRQQRPSHDWEFQEDQNSRGSMTRDFGYNSLEVWA